MVSDGRLAKSEEFSQSMWWVARRFMEKKMTMHIKVSTSSSRHARLKKRIWWGTRAAKPNAEQPSIAARTVNEAVPIPSMTLYHRIHLQ
eukprot:scaffold441528_cov40-Prasinocladus_malaysianus.AAC.1